MSSREKHPTPTAETVKKTFRQVVDWLRLKAITCSPFACGYISTGLHYHDHPYKGLFGRIMTGPYVERIDGVPSIFPTPYDENVHGSVVDFVEEGKQVPGVTSVDDRRLIHRHDNTTNMTGPYEFNNE